MEVKKNTGAPQLHVDWKHLFLVAIHASALVLSLTMHGVWTTEVVPRALP